MTDHWDVKQRYLAERGATQSSFVRTWLSIAWLRVAGGGRGGGGGGHVEIQCEGGQ